MSKSPADHGTQAPKSHLSDPISAWVEKLLPQLLGAQQAKTTTSDAVKQSGPKTSEPPLMQGGIPIGPYEKMLEQKKRDAFDPKKQREAAEKANQKSEAEKRAREANKPFDFVEASRERYQQPSNPALRISNQKSPILEANETFGLRDDDYEKLDDRLKSKMSMKVWMAVESQRHILRAVYYELRKYGIWDLVTEVIGIQEQLRWHGTLGPLKFSAHATGGIAFKAKASELITTLTGSSHFGVDGGMMGAMHPGQTSVRSSKPDYGVVPKKVLENSYHAWSVNNPYPTDSLHISIGPGDRFDAHMDSISPVGKPAGGQTTMGTDGYDHFDFEAGLTKNNIIRVPRIATENEIGPNQKMTAKKIVVNAVFEFGANEDKHKRKTSQAPPPAPDKIEKRICSQARKVIQQFPRLTAKDLDPGELGVFMARSALQAAKNGETTIGVDFPNYAKTVLNDAEVKIVRQAVREIGKIVSGELGSEVATVKLATVRLPAQGAFDVGIQ